MSLILVRSLSISPLNTSSVHSSRCTIFRSSVTLVYGVSIHLVIFNTVIYSRLLHLSAVRIVWTDVVFPLVDFYSVFSHTEVFFTSACDPVLFDFFKNPVLSWFFDQNNVLSKLPADATPPWSYYQINQVLYHISPHFSYCYWTHPDSNLLQTLYSLRTLPDFNEDLYSHMGSNIILFSTADGYNPQFSINGVLRVISYLSSVHKSLLLPASHLELCGSTYSPYVNSLCHVTNSMLTNSVTFLQDEASSNGLTTTDSSSVTNIITIASSVLSIGPFYDLPPISPMPVLGDNLNMDDYLNFSVDMPSPSRDVFLNPSSLVTSFDPTDSVVSCAPIDTSPRLLYSVKPPFIPRIVSLDDVDLDFESNSSLEIYDRLLPKKA